MGGLFVLIQYYFRYQIAYIDLISIEQIKKGVFGFGDFFLMPLMQFVENQNNELQIDDKFKKVLI